MLGINTCNFMFKSQNICWLTEIQIITIICLFDMYRVANQEVVYIDHKFHLENAATGVNISYMGTNKRRYIISPLLVNYNFYCVCHPQICGFLSFMGLFNRPSVPCSGVLLGIQAYGSLLKNFSIR